MPRIHRRSRAARSAGAPSRPPALSAAGTCAAARARAPRRLDESADPCASAQVLSVGDPEKHVVQIRTPDAPGRGPRAHLRLQPGDRGDVLVATAEVRYVALAQPGPEPRPDPPVQAVDI